MTKKEAVKYFKEFILPNIPSKDKPAKSEAWGIYIDGLCKNGEITSKQYETWGYE